MKKTFVVLASMMISVPALAEWAGSLGVRQTSAACDEVNGGTCTGVSNKAEMPFQIGAIYNHEFAPSWALRTGALYTQRNYKFEAGTGDNKQTLTYVDVPVTANYKFNDTWGAFGGIVAGVKMADSCENAAGGSCELQEVKSLITPLTLGAQARFAEWGVELAYETDSAAYFEGAKNQSAIGINGLYWF